MFGGGEQSFCAGPVAASALLGDLRQGPGAGSGFADAAGSPLGADRLCAGRGCGDVFQQLSPQILVADGPGDLLGAGRIDVDAASASSPMASFRSSRSRIRWTSFTASGSSGL